MIEDIRKSLLDQTVSALKLLNAVDWNKFPKVIPLEIQSLIFDIRHLQTLILEAKTAEEFEALGILSKEISERLV
jgi:hypothetical protein